MAENKNNINDDFSKKMENLKIKNFHNMNNLNSLKTPENGTNDRLADVRLRLAVIDNYELEPKNGKIKPLEDYHVVNMNTGKVVVRWLDHNGGLLRPSQFAYPNKGYPEPWSYFPEKDSKYPEERTLECYNHDRASEREMIPLTHTFIWSNGKNWSGINYLPPIGTIVIVGFQKNGLPIILGTLQSNYEKCKPYLKMGETMIKGYGNNYIHWRWSDKLDAHVWCKRNEIDIDDPYKTDRYPHDIDMWVRFDCYTSNLWIEVSQLDLEDHKTTTIEIKPSGISIDTFHVEAKRESICNITNDDIFAKSSDANTQEESSVYISPKNIGLDVIKPGASSSYKMTAENIDITAKENIKIASKKANIECESLTINCKNDVIVNAGGNISLNSGSHVSLNPPLHCAKEGSVCD